MFDRIAPRYDLMNRLTTLGLDQKWRRSGLARVKAGPGDLVLDLACGTGDLTALALKRGAAVLGVDYAGSMLAAAMERTGREKASPADPPFQFIQADAGRLPVKSASVDVVVCGFGLRNFVDLEQVAVEMARVLTPNGRMMALEVCRPRNRFFRTCHALYFEKGVPLLGALLSDRHAYQYLPDSIYYLPQGEALLSLFRQAGFAGVRQKLLLFGAAQVITGMKRG
jgi:demethylmenaquinone methyltransferase/2-methoxy-6-polyprenyl-1,4-benzoquinol methylase